VCVQYIATMENCDGGWTELLPEVEIDLKTAVFFRAANLIFARVILDDHVLSVRLKFRIVSGRDLWSRGYTFPYTTI
jgi:hypothetical protein